MVIWSRVPEFALYSNASAVIPYFEFYLNNVMNEVRSELGAADSVLDEELTGASTTASTAGSRIIFDVYRKDMTPAERKASQRIVRRIKWRQQLSTIPRVLTLFNPGSIRIESGRPRGSRRRSISSTREGPIGENCIEAYVRGPKAAA